MDEIKNKALNSSSTHQPIRIERRICEGEKMTKTDFNNQSRTLSEKFDLFLIFFRFLIPIFEQNLVLLTIHQMRAGYGQFREHLN